LGFSEQEVLSFERNLRLYRDLGFTVRCPTDNDFSSTLDDILHNVSTDDLSLRVVVDVSSLTRNRIAWVCEAFYERVRDKAVLVDFVYFVARYQRPRKRTKQNAHAGPVIPSLAGWWRYPELPSAAVIGLGYEENKALGAVELLQIPEAIWTFLPKSIVPQYDGDLQTANKDLFMRVPDEQRISYRVEDPFETYNMMSQLARTLTETNNVVLLPFGPKLFCLLSTIVAMQQRNTTVWRISAGAQETPRNAFAVGNPIGVRLTLDACRDRR
jgi:hypothetical protein